MIFNPAELALIEAIKNGDVPRARELLEGNHGININGADYSLLHRACAQNSPDSGEMVELLIQHYAHIEAGTPVYKHRPLQLAAYYRKTACAAALLKHGAEPNAGIIATNRERCTPLFLAIMESTKESYGDLIQRTEAQENNLEPMLTLLLQHDPLLISSQTLKEACRQNNAAVMRRLFQRHQQNLKAKSSNTFSEIEMAQALGQAATTGNLDLVKEFLKLSGLEGKSLHAASHYGNILHRAAENNHAEIVRLFLSMGADANAIERRQDHYLRPAEMINWRSNPEQASATQKVFAEFAQKPQVQPTAPKKRWWRR